MEVLKKNKKYMKGLKINKNYTEALPLKGETREERIHEIFKILNDETESSVIMNEPQLEKQNEETKIQITKGLVIPIRQVKVIELNNLEKLMRNFVSVKAIINDSVQKFTLKNNPYSVVNISDESGEFELKLFGDDYKLFNSTFEKNKRFEIIMWIYWFYNQRVYTIIDIK